MRKIKVKIIDSSLSTEHGWTEFSGRQLGNMEINEHGFPVIWLLHGTKMFTAVHTRNGWVLDTRNREND